MSCVFRYQNQLQPWLSAPHPSGQLFRALKLSKSRTSRCRRGEIHLTWLEISVQNFLPRKWQFRIFHRRHYYRNSAVILRSPSGHLQNALQATLKEATPNSCCRRQTGSTGILQHRSSELPGLCYQQLSSKDFCHLQEKKDVGPVSGVSSVIESL